MPLYVLIHTTTRVARRWTVSDDVAQSPASDETTVNLGEPPGNPPHPGADFGRPSADGSRRFVKLAVAGNAWEVPTAQEVDDASVDDVRVSQIQRQRFAAFRNQLIAVRDDVTMPNQIRLLCQRFLEYLPVIGG